MKSWKRVLVTAALAGVGTLTAGAAVKKAQTVTLETGWNAVYLEVSPDETADEIFSSWPVERVGVYDPAAFLETKQYSGTETTEGASSTGYQMWRRGEEALSTLGGIVANQIYLCNNTNDAPFTTTLYGRPAAPCFTWHPSATNEPMNLVGLSVAADATTTLGAYFDGLTAGNVNYYRLNGYDLEATTKVQLSPIGSAETFTDGAVVIASASKVSDWSGVLNVTPLTGLDFSTNLNYRTLTTWVGDKSPFAADSQLSSRYVTNYNSLRAERERGCRGCALVVLCAPRAQ